MFQRFLEDDNGHTLGCPEEQDSVMKPTAYQWKLKDKLFYALAIIPFLTGFVGTVYLLSTYSALLMLIWLALYIVTNVFQAGCCVGCPYRGQYCPALCGVYLGNFLSGILYKDKQFEQAFFEHNAKAGETMLFICIVFPLYWIFNTGWYLVPVYLLRLGVHFLIFMPTQCEKCGYNTTCPGGQTWLNCRQKLGFQRNLGE
jgi:hypothetical protein